MTHIPNKVFDQGRSCHWPVCVKCGGNARLYKEGQWWCPPCRPDTDCRSAHAQLQARRDQKRAQLLAKMNF